MAKCSFIFWGFLSFTLIKDSFAGCNRALGMEKKTINDSQITASSTRSDHLYKPSFGRLNLNKGSGGWCPDDSDQHPYLQIDLLTPHTITKIASQGARGSSSNRMQEYRLSYSYDNRRWFNYTINGNVTVFEGNQNPFLKQVNELKMPVTGRVFRIHPIIKDKHISTCARVELYGCQPSEDCTKSVGVEDGRITDQQMTASSHFNEHYASNARLNNKASTDKNGNERWGGWCTDADDKNQYLQVDMGQVRSVSGVATQGYMMGMYVTQYKLNYSTDGVTWQSYREKGPNSGTKIFQGNWDNDTVIKRAFPRRIFARFIRFNPIAFPVGGYICMRVEIYECLPTEGSVPRVSPPSGTVELNRTSSVNLTCHVTGQPVAHVEWYRNRQRILPSPLIRRIQYGNGSIESVLTLKKVKYRDRGTIISCSAWYPTLPINSTRNVLLLVHAPRPVIIISEVQARQVVLHVRDPTPTDTSQYLVRYKADPGHSSWVEEKRNKSGQGGDAWITLHGVHPYTSYTVEVASYYRDEDIGPYSVNKHFTTKQAAPSGPPRDVLVMPRGENGMRVSWSIPSAKDCNGRITKYEIVVYKQNGDVQTYLSGEKTLSKDVIGLEANQRFYIGVRAYTIVGPGPYSMNQTHSTVLSQQSQVTKALEKLNKIPVTSSNALKVVTEVRNITSKPSKLLHKDLSVTAKILDNVVKTNVTSVDVGDQVLHTISHVMDANPKVLEDAQRKNNKSARFVQIIEDYLDKGGKFSKGTSNIGVHTQVITKTGSDIGVAVKATDDNIAINTTNNGTSEDSEASITVPGSILSGNDTDNSTLIVVYYRTSKLFAPEYRKAEVCEDGFTKEKDHKLERSETSSYTMENSTGSRVTTSSPVLSASLRNKEVSNLTTPVIIKFKMPREEVIKSSTRCVWWDFQKRGWSTAGCSLRGIVNDTIICECNHMTNFAALVDLDGPSSKACGKHSTALSLISYIGCALSIVGLTLTILTFAFFKKLRKDQIAAKILLHLCASLLCVLIVFVAGVERGTVSEDACRIVAALVHYFLLVAFLWMLIEAYFMYQAFVKVFRDYGEHVMWKCSALGWGLPFVVVVITIAVDKTSYGGKHYCRLGDIAFFASFAAPVVFVMLVNTITFSLIMYKLATRPPNAADPSGGSEGLLKIKRAFGILILVGITWVFGFFAIADARLVFHYLFAICNSLQGFAIFVFYCVIQRKVRECWWALLTCNLRSLKKSKSLFTDSNYDRRRLSSASRAQLDTMRPRINTAMSQVQITLPRDPQNPPPDVVRDCPHHSNVVYEDDSPYPSLNIESVDYQLNEMSGSQTIEMNDSWDYHSMRVSYRADSRSPSLRSHGMNLAPSHNSSVQASPASSAHSSPKILRSPRIFPLQTRQAPRESTPRQDYPLKETLKRTASHTPEATTRPANRSLLRRTKSASLSLEDLRFSADFSVSSDQTSWESLSSEAATPTKKQLLGVPFGEQIVGPIRGSIRGFVGYVETTVENFDLLIDLQRLRSQSSPAHADDQV